MELGLHFRTCRGSSDGKLLPSKGCQIMSGEVALSVKVVSPSSQVFPGQRQRGKLSVISKLAGFHLVTLEQRKSNTVLVS